MYKLFLTIRYVFKPLSLVTIFALAASVVIFTAAPSVMNGFQEDFHARIRGTMSDMILRSDQLLTVPLSPELQNALAAVPGVKAVAPFIEHPALHREFDKADYCMLRGIDPFQEEKVGEFRQFIMSERDWYLEQKEFDVLKEPRKSEVAKRSKSYAPSPEKAKEELDAAEKALAQAKTAGKDTKEVARLEDEASTCKLLHEQAKTYLERIYRQLDEGVDDPLEPSKKIPAVLGGVFFMKVYDKRPGGGLDGIVKLTTAAGDNKEVQQDKRFAIVGAFRAGSHDTDRRVLYMGLRTAQEFIGTKKISGYAIKLNNYDEARAVRPKCYEAVQSLAKKHDLGMEFIHIKTWEQQNENLLRAVGMERLLIKLITGMIVFAASATIFLVVFMNVQTKVRELGILRAVGGSAAGTLQIFLGQGFLLAVLGMLLGSAAGLIGAHYINELAAVIHRLTGWHPFPPEVYYLERIPSKIYWSELVVNAAFTMLFGFVFALIPAIQAAVRAPIRAIRHD
ncbi:MAG: ABC transporter permease [Planctomycetota bacterium]